MLHEMVDDVGWRMEKNSGREIVTANLPTYPLLTLKHI